MEETMADNVSEVETDSLPQPEATESANAVDTVQAPAFAIPDEYKERGWAKNINSYEALFKSYDNAQSLIGKKAGDKIPDFEKATDEQLADFYGKTRPKEASEYDCEGLTDEEAEITRKTFYENGINKRQAKAILDQFKNIMIDKNETKYGKEGLQKAMTGAFGANWQQSTVPIENVLKSVLTADDVKEISDNMTNEGVVALYKATNAIMNKYGARESDFATSAGVERPAKMEYAEFYKKMKEADRMPNGFAVKQQLKKQYYGE